MLTTRGCGLEATIISTAGQGVGSHETQETKISCVVADRKEPCKRETPQRRGPGVSGRLVSKSNLWKGTLWTPFGGPSCWFVTQKRLFPLITVWPLGDRMSVSTRACNWLDWTCAEEPSQFSSMLWTSEPWMFQPQAGIKVEGVVRFEGGNVEVSTPTVS